MKKLPIDLVVDLKEAFDPIMREQLRGLTASKVMAQLVGGWSESHVRAELPRLAALSVDAADALLRALHMPEA